MEDSTSKVRLSHLPAKHFEYYEDGLKYSETPFVNGKEHGMEITYHEDGSKTWETPYVDGKEHGTQIWYREDGSKEREAVFENGNKISEKDF